MPRPKKAEKQKKEEVVLDLRQDREEFLRAFEKPTQIYRFLRARHSISPIFMHRNLLYMINRCSRNNARRKVFRINDMLTRCTQSCDVKKSVVPKYDQLKITVTGFYIDPGVSSENSMGKKLSEIDTEVSLRKTFRCRRKDGESLQDEQRLGVVDVSVNPRHAENYVIEPIVLDATNLFLMSDGQTVKNYTLVFRVYEPNDSSDSSSESDENADSENESISDTSADGRNRKGKDDPAAISLRNLTTGSRRRHIANNDDKSDDESSNVTQNDTSRKVKKSSSERNQAAIYEAELDVYTSDRRIILVDGEYELSLIRKHARASDGRKNATWEALDGGREVKVLSTMTNAPVLKFNLQWSACGKLGPLAETSVDHSKLSSDEPEAKRVRRKLSNKGEDDETTENGTSSPLPKFPVDSVNYRRTPHTWTKARQNDDNENGFEDPPRIFYQFIYNNESHQQTEARNDLYCPWCQLNCLTLYGLVKHLKMTHPRFHFVYIPQEQGTCIEVSVNECYDGSYCGNPQFVYCQPGMAFSRRGPVRRIPVTDTLFFRSERDRHPIKMDPYELLEKEENESPPAAHYAAGHHRLYFHSETNIPIRPCEFDCDSEEEPDPDWLKDHIQKMLDEFTDVNDGEKPLMKLWNMYVMKNCCIADGQMAETCRAFLDANGATIHRHNLRRNLLLHLVTLVDFGVLKTSALLSLMQHFDKIAEKVPSPEKNASFFDSVSQNGHQIVEKAGKTSKATDFCSSEKSAHLEHLQKIISEAELAETVL